LSSGIRWRCCSAPVHSPRKCTCTYELRYGWSWPASTRRLWWPSCWRSSRWLWRSWKQSRTILASALDAPTAHGPITHDASVAHVPASTLDAPATNQPDALNGPTSSKQSIPALGSLSLASTACPARQQFLKHCLKHGSRVLTRRRKARVQRS